MGTYNLVSTISELPKLIGCQDFPSSQQGMQLIKLISDFINEEYQYSGQQVTEAFKMAVKRQLYLDNKRIDPSTFGQYLSINVVGQVLTAYKESKQQTKAQPTKGNWDQLGEYKKQLITNEQAWELVVRFTKEDGKFPLAAPFLGAYQYLLEKKAIQPVKKSSKQMFASELSSPERTAVEKYITTNILNK